MEVGFILYSSNGKKGLLSAILTALFVISNIPVVTGVGVEPITTVTWFEDGPVQEDIQFLVPGTNTDTASLSFQTGVDVDNATLTVEGGQLGGENPSNITIDIGGDGQPEWRFGGEAYGALGHQEYFLLNGQAENLTANLTITGSGGNNDSASVRIPYGATITKADTELEVKGVSIAIECKSGSRSCNSLNNDPVYSLKSLFESRGWTATIVSGQDIDTVAELNDYTVVVLGDAGSNDDDHSVFQTALKSWVETNGGGLVAFGWIIYSTPANSAMDQILPVSPGYKYSTGPITITNTNHAITQGINNFNTPSGAHCESPAGGADPGATVLGTCAGDTIVEWTKGVGRVVYIGPNFYGDFASYNSEGWYTDANAKRLAQNAALWASGGGTLSGYIDIGNDGTREWDKQDFNGSEVLNDFSANLNNYLVNAGPSGTDEYGNQYVDVPIRVSSTGGGMISLYNLSIDYTYQATVDKNPHNVSLTNEINSFIPPELGTSNVSIPIHVTSDTAGKIVLGSFHADIIDPSHPPLIISTLPSQQDLEIDENTTIEFHVEAEDWYRHPVTFEWSQDGELNTTGDAYDYHANFESMGLHTIKVVADNAMEQSDYSWSVMVRNVNRPPIIVGSEPELKTTVEENTTRTFSVDAYDPDLTDHVGYAWLLDGIPVGGRESTHDYSPGFKDQGLHDLKCVVQDQRNLKVEVLWDIEVIDVNDPPKIYSATPKEDPTMNENASMNFIIKASNKDDDILSYVWSVDDVEQDGEDGMTFLYRTDHEDAGTHEVKVVVSDGVDTASWRWSVQVMDVNRPPVPLISTPKELDVFLTIDNIYLSAEGSSDPDGDDLVYEWFQERSKVGNGKEVTINLDKGSHKILLVVDDGREGISSTWVNIMVNELDFNIDIEQDIEKPLEGDQITFDVILVNSGNGMGEDLVVHFLMDDKIVGEDNISASYPGDTHELRFKWLSEEGNHIFSVKVGNVESQKNVGVGPAPIIDAGIGGQQSNMVFGIILVIMIAVIIVALVVALRRKKVRAMKEEVASGPTTDQSLSYPRAQAVSPYPEAKQPAFPDPYPPPPPPPMVQARAVPPSRSDPYRQPCRTTARPVPPSPPPQPVPAIPPVPTFAQEINHGPQPYEMDTAALTNERDTRTDIERMENVIFEAEGRGMDTGRARNYLKLAKSFQKKGMSEKVLQYVSKAEGALRP